MSITLTRKSLACSLVWLLAAAAACRAEVPAGVPTPAADPNSAGPANVLVVYNATSKDLDKNGKPDGLEAAEYYAERRGVPAENLLALNLDPAKYRLDYADFYKQILTPVHDKLQSKGADGAPLSSRILYILLTPGIPHVLDTHQDSSECPFGKSGAAARSVDQWLISLDQNFEAGFDEGSGKPGKTASRIRLDQLSVEGRPLAQVQYEGKPVTAITVGGQPLGAIVAEKEGKLGELVVAGAKLGDVMIGAVRLGGLE